MCNACDVKQAPSRSCTNSNCLIPFSTNHCEICMIWTQSDIFHCAGCGLCRVGKSDTLFHCDTCEACFHISTRDTHFCTKISMKHQRCPLCLEDTHFSQKRCVVMRCGHVGHFDCLQEAWTHETGGNLLLHYFKSIFKRPCLSFSVLYYPFYLFIICKFLIYLISNPNSSNANEMNNPN